MDKTADALYVATKAELAEGPKVVRGSHHNIVVFQDADQCYAVDNRCPHMGFPLERGTVRDGILTCHWHQARFDLNSGCTFDLWADDVLKFETWVTDDGVYVAPDPQEERGADFFARRLIEGIEQNVSLVQAKSLISLLEMNSSPDQLIDRIVDYASANLNQITEGMTRLGCIANLHPNLSDEVAYQGLFYAIRQIAQETANAVPHRNKAALAGSDYTLAQLKQWLHQWVQTRHQDGTERTLLTGVETLTSADLADLVFSTASERLFANGGHLLESCNKVFEYGERLGNDRMKKLLPLLTGTLTGARGQEESTNWHHPIEIVAPLQALDGEMPELLAANDGSGSLAAMDMDVEAILLGDDPIAIIQCLRTALQDNIAPVQIAQVVCYAAALRLARFATSNEVTDWFNPQHTFIYCHSAWRAVKRSPTPEVVRTVIQGSISIYMDRFLNVPAARLPVERNTPILKAQGADLLADLLNQLDQRADIDDAAFITASYLRAGNPLPELIDTLTLATVREDLDFHCLQVLDAATQQCVAWQGHPDVVENIMVGVTRNLAAHCPTRRAGQQTARIAAKLQRGEAIYE